MLYIYEDDGGWLTADASPDASAAFLASASEASL